MKKKLMKRMDKKPGLLYFTPTLKEMIRYQAWKEHKSQNALIEQILTNSLEKAMAKDEHFKEVIINFEASKF